MYGLVSLGQDEEKEKYKLTDLVIGYGRGRRQSCLSNVGLTYWVDGGAFIGYGRGTWELKKLEVCWPGPREDVGELKRFENRELSNGQIRRDLELNIATEPW